MLILKEHFLKNRKLNIVQRISQLIHKYLNKRETIILSVR